MSDPLWDALVEAAGEDEVAVADEVREAVKSHLRARRARKAKEAAVASRPHALAS